MPVFKRLQYNSPVILTFAILSFLVLLLDSVTGGASTLLYFSVYRSPLDNPLTYARLFTHALGHISFAHFYGNIIIILLVGPMLEEKYGSMRMLLMILVTAAVAGIVNMIFYPQSLLLGASGIVFMLIVLSSFVNLQKGRIPLTFILIMVIYIGQEILSLATKTDNVSYPTHIAGGLCGAVLGFVFNRTGDADTYGAVRDTDT